MANCLVTLNIKKGVFMDLENQITVLGWKMKWCPLIIINHKLISLLAGVLLVGSSLTAAAESLPYYNDQAFTPYWIESNSPELDNFHQIPAFSFVNQEVEKVTEKTFEDKIYVAGFFFSTCPRICPMIRSKLIKVQDKFIDDPNVKILQHSIRPNTDTIEILKTYAGKNGIVSDKWHLVTGDR